MPWVVEAVVVVLLLLGLIFGSLFSAILDVSLAIETCDANPICEDLPTGFIVALRVQNITHVSEIFALRCYPTLLPLQKTIVAALLPCIGNSKLANWSHLDVNCKLI